jgi:hypothetical protein
VVKGGLPEDRESTERGHFPRSGNGRSGEELLLLGNFSGGSPGKPGTIRRSNATALSPRQPIVRKSSRKSLVHELSEARSRLREP